MVTHEAVASDDSPLNGISGTTIPSHRGTRRMAVRPLLVLLLLVNLAMSLYQLPLNRVIERRVCREYYSDNDPKKINPDGSVDEKLCKIDLVQQTLGSLQGVMETIWIVGDFVMTLPLGFLAQRKGRRVVLWMNLISRGFMLSWAVIVGYFEHVLPTKAIVAGPLLSVLGGDCVFNSITYALVAELTDDPVRRAIYFGYMSSVTYVVNLLGPALASITMSILLWFPFCIGVLLLGVAASAVSKLPSSPGDEGYMPSPSPSSDPEEQRQHLLSSPVLKARESINDASIWRSVGDHVRELLNIISTHPRNFSLLLLGFFFTSLASSDTKLLVQYISAKYHWAFASAGYLLSGKAVVNFVLLTVVVPRFLRSLKATDKASVDRSNLDCAKYCLAVSVLGALGIAISSAIWMLVPSLLVYALGSALPIFTLSLLKSSAICPPAGSTETQIYSIVMLVKTIGSLLGAPVMAAFWVNGIRIGGLALGLPYFLSAQCYLVAIGILAKIELY